MEISYILLRSRLPAIPQNQWSARFGILTGLKQESLDVRGCLHGEETTAVERECLDRAGSENSSLNRTCIFSKALSTGYQAQAYKGFIDRSKVRVVKPDNNSENLSLANQLQSVEYITSHQL